LQLRFFYCLGSLISEEDVTHLNEVEEKLAKVEEASGSASPERVSPPFPPPFMHKRQSSFQSRSTTSENLRQAPAADSSTLLSMNNESTKEGEMVPQPSTSNEEIKSKASQGQGNQQTVNTFPGGFTSMGSPTMPHSQTWAPLTIPPFQSVQSLDKPPVQATNPFYPMPLIGPSTSYPYALSTALMIPPYATLPFPHQLLSEQQISPPNQRLPEKPYDATDLSALQLTMSLDQYNQHLIRSQLDQAQQTAQVASCQVQLLRDQLTTETTARIEAQVCINSDCILIFFFDCYAMLNHNKSTRTHQLLNANRELLEQVQALVGRLQLLESKIAADIQGTEKDTMDPRVPLVPTLPQAVPTQSTSAADTTQKSKNQEAPYTLQNRSGLNYMPTSMTTDSLKIYQLKPLADLRAGSLPPKTGDSEDERRKRKDDADKGGAKTEPESATEDVSDSSSDQGDKPSGGESSAYMSNLAFPMYQNILLSNPQVMPLFSPYFPTTIQNTQIPSPTHMYQTPEKKEASAKKNKDDRTQEAGPSNSSIIRRSTRIAGVPVNSEFEFKRMSFNENPRRSERKKNSPKAGNISPLSKVSEESQPFNDGAGSLRKPKDLKKLPDKAETSAKNLLSLNLSPTRTTLFGERSSQLDISLPAGDNGTNYASVNPSSSKIRRSSFCDKNVERVLASSTLATAMYPPKSSISIGRPEVLKRRIIRTLSVDMKTPPTFGERPSASTAISHESNPELKSRSFKGRLGKSDGIGRSYTISADESSSMTPADSSESKVQSSSATDDAEKSQSFMDSQKQKLSDPTILAKLTQRMPVQTTSEFSTKTFLPNGGIR
uniref:CCHC-type domain-containing protein n=1 Tax=Enterobius vermicularis TaxID=51028 RepID=A0A0N4V6X6_ENTVE